MRPQPLSEIRVRRRVEFADTDMAGLIHFSRYYIFMETAEHLLLEAIGSSVALDRDGRHLGWPRVSNACEYRRPLRFADEVEIRLFVLRRGRRSMTYGCEFFHDGELVARGQSTCACCIVDADGVHPVDIPAAIADNLVEVGEEEKERWRPPVRALSS